MAASISPSTTSTSVNIVNDEKFAQIYTPDEEAVQILDNQRTVMNVKFGICGCALGIHSYSSGIHCIRIRIDSGSLIFGIRSRNIEPVPDLYCGHYYGHNPSTYGWGRGLIRILNGSCQYFGLEQIKNHSKNDSHAYALTLNCDEHRLTIIDEDTKEHDEMEVDVSCAPLPWCLVIAFGRSGSRVSFI
jgi:hypothetical protein